MTEFEFVKTIVFKKYPLKVAFLVLNELIGAVFVVAGIGAIVPLLGTLVEGSAKVPGKLGEIIETLGLADASSTTIMTFLLVVMLVRYGLDAVRGYLAGNLTVTLNQTFKKQINEKISASDWVYFLNEDQGKYIQSMTLESMTASGAVNDLAALIAYSVLLSMILATMILFSAPTFAVVVVAGLIMVVCSRALMKKSRVAAEDRIKAMNRLNNFIIDNRNIMKLLKAEGLVEKRNMIADDLIEQGAEAEKKQIRYVISVEGANNLFTLFLTGLLAFLYLKIGFGDGASLIFNLLLIQRVGSYFATIQMKRRNMLQKIPSYETCVEMIEVPTVRMLPTGSSSVQPTLEQGIALQNVAFSYPNGTTAITGVTLDFPAKGLVALVGRSGSGKTTIIDMLLGLIHPQQGRITIDGVPADTVDQTAWRKMLTYVPQNAYLFQGTLRDNLTLGVDAATDDEIWAALGRANCADLIRRIPGQLDMPVTSGGGNFSGGERQKLSIARAILRGSRVLIMDEPSASLDKNSEQEIRKTIQAVSSDMLVIVITHSPNFVEGIDRIFLISAGQCVWRGGYDELHANARLWADFAADDAPNPALKTPLLN